MAYNPNQKHPKIDFKGKYPNMYVTQGIDGYQLIRSLEPGLESFFEIMTTGSYRGHGPKGEEVNVTMDKQHNYVSGGVSEHTDGHRHESTMQSKTSVNASEHKETKGNKSEAGGGVHIAGSKDSKMEAQTQGDKHQVTKGHIITDHTGDINYNLTGDVVNMIKGNKHETVSSGEYGINIQNGNFDKKINAGKLRYDVAKNVSIISHDQINMLVDAGVGSISSKATQLVRQQVGDQSNTIITPATITIQTTDNITIKCGSSSIILTPDGITIKGTSISFVQ